MSESRDINWQAVHERLQATGQLLDEAFAPAPEVVQSILEKRAEKAARTTDSIRRDVEERTLLLVEAGDHVAGIAMEWVAEVIPLSQGHAPVPEADERLLGLINVHNQLINLVSPWFLMDASPMAVARHFNQAVLLQHPRLKVAIGCTRALRMVSLPASAWQSDRLFLYEAGSAPGVLLDIPALFKSWEQNEEHPAA